MTALPQRTALSHAFGALAASLVGIAEYYTHHEHLGGFKMTAISLEVLLGSLTTTGSSIACAKLQGMLPGAPMTFKGQNLFNMALILVTVGLFFYLLANPAAGWAFYLMMSLSFVFGVMLVLPIGSADMPVVDGVVELLRRSRRRRHWLRHLQQRPHHCGNARWFLRLHSFHRDVQGDEPFHHQRPLRRLWQRQQR